MFKRFLPKNLDFFDLFERHAAKTQEAVKIMYKVLQDIKQHKSEIEGIEELEHQCDSVAHMTVDLLRRSFITPFEREEIRSLISAMDDIIDFLDAAAHRIILFEISEVPPEVVKLCDVLQKAQEHVVLIVTLLRKMKKNEELTNHCKEINRLENEGDKLHRAGIAALFHQQKDPLMVIKLKELYEMLEQAVDRCEDVANVVEGIIIEHGE